MTTKKRRGLGPTTLREASELLGHMRPGPGASAETWLKFYRRSAAVYAEVAEIDRGHHHEALYWSNRERARANKLADEIRKNPTPTTATTRKEGREEPPASARVHTEL